MQVLTGEYVVVLAQATIPATGYSDRLHARSTGTREMSADGIAMAWRAGATMVNLEMQWWHTNDVAYPPTWQRMQIYPNPMLGSEKSARMVNSEGEEFFNQQVDDPLAFGPYTVQLKALANKCMPARHVIPAATSPGSITARRAKWMPTRLIARSIGSSGWTFPNR